MSATIHTSMGWVDRMKAAWQLLFRTSFADQDSPPPDFVQRQVLYSHRWALYRGAVFEDIDDWAGYINRYRLYKNIRMIYNLVPRLVDFQVAVLYPGVLTIDASRLPEGMPIAIPIAEDTEQSLKDAIGQIWQWTNYLDLIRMGARFTAATGNALLEVTDDVAGGKVGYKLNWPGRVKDIELNQAGDVLSYTLEYQSQDAEGNKFMYRKEVNQDEYRTFKDDKLFAYPGNTDAEGRALARWPNPYRAPGETRGFVPACYFKFLDDGGTVSVPAYRSSLGKVDELNSFASALNDAVAKAARSPWFLTGGAGIKRLFFKKTGQTTEEAAEAADRESLLILTGPVQAAAHSLASTVDLDGADKLVDRIMQELNDDFPEITMFKKLREMSTVTGPAARLLFGDVELRKTEIEPGFDRQVRKSLQMAIAIGGWRASSGHWGALNSQQRKLQPFGLTSYKQDRMSFDINPRPLFGNNPDYHLDLDKKRIDNANAIMLNYPLPDEDYLVRVGYSEEEAADIVDRVAQNPPEPVTNEFPPQSTGLPAPNAGV